MRIENSQLRLSGESLHVREQVRIRQSAAPAVRTTAQPPRVEEPAPEQSNEPLDPKLRAAKLIAARMLGREIDLRGSAAHPAKHAAKHAAAANTAAGPEPRVRTIEVRAEAEDLRFRARGVVETADGRRIEFQASLEMSYRRVEINVTAPDANANRKDPLVLNFDGRGPRLLDDRVEFDLTGDGQAELTPVVARGSGILFADGNGDRVANNGSELFGPRSGDGFADLAARDSDSNGWIDEADPVYGELRVWFQEAGGGGSTYSLAELGVGAISTASAETRFGLRGARSEVLGEIRASGVYLRENGQAGVISQVDFTV